jgi:ABC-type polysaccharide/polyol phosphate export permease
MVILALFGLGVALLLSVANTYFRDTEHFVQIAFSLWFYLTPVIYPYSRVAEHLKRHVLGVKLSTVYELNPMTRFVNVFRDLLYNNRFPNWGDVAVCAGVAAVALTVGSIVFSRFEPRLAEEL